MVVLTKPFIERQAARAVVQRLGVPERVLRATEETNPGADWIGVMNALDRVFLSRGGGMGQVLFLRECHDGLDGNTPLASLPRPGGPNRVCAAAREFSGT